ncbi:hypothetical protein, partial [Nostoc sp. S13]
MSKKFLLHHRKTSIILPGSNIYKKISPAYFMATASPNEKPIFGRFCSTSINVMLSPTNHEAGLILTSKESNGVFVLIFRFPINKEYHTSSQFTCAEELIYKQYSWLQLVISYKASKPTIALFCCLDLRKYL